ncbi:MAG: DUF2953 domain-containing protein [Clostridiales bacterium]|nr:DUF2953 domain-containing protein [Clostridiales bacterium]
MLALLLGVLKIVGIVLLIILGIILLLILLVLLVPIRYRVEGAFDGKPAGLAKVTWLLHLISAKAEYQEALDVTVRVLGFRVFGMKLPEEAGEDASPKTKPDAGSKTKSHGKASSGAGEDTDEDAGTENLKGCESSAESKKKNAEKTGKEEINREDDGGVRAEAKTEVKAETKAKIKVNNTEAADLKKTDGVEQTIHIEGMDGKEETTGNNIEETQPQSSSSFLTGIYEKLNAKCVGTIRGILQKIRSVAAAAREKFQAIRDKEEWAVAFLKNKDNQKTFCLMKRQIFRLIRHIFPQKLSGRVKFGFDDPSTTGQILTYISPFYGCYAGKLELIPVFEEKVLEGEVSLKGRARILTVLWIAARMLFDRNFRKLIRWFLDRER